jgi:hypothetical protein
MKIILMAGFKKDKESSIISMSNFIKNNYNVKYIYHADTNRCKYTLCILTKLLTELSIIPTPTTTPVKSLNVKYISDKNSDINSKLKNNITDVDLWDRTEKYEEVIRTMRKDSDDIMDKRLRAVYDNILSHHLNASYDIVIIADDLAISSLVENLFKINRYYSFRNIGCFISVVNTKTKLLDVHKFYI